MSPVGQNTSVYHIFERLNTGGTPLRPQEIRNVVFRGDFALMLKELNKDLNWRELLGKYTYDKHQTDVELLLRVFALSNRDKDYEKPMKEFINKAMHKYQKGQASKVTLFQEQFPKITKIVHETLGQRPFHLRGKLNTSALDSVLCTLLENFGREPKNLKQRYKALVDDPIFETLTTIGTTDTATVKKRLEMVKRYIIL